MSNDSSIPETNEEIQHGGSPFKRADYIKILLLSLAVFILVAVFVNYKYFYKPKTNFDQAVLQSNLALDQKPLQDYALQQLKAGVNDDKLKEAIFLISHRFFDNGGNIYEIYDFVNSHDEVAFLREADKLEPEAFQLVKERKVEKYDTPSTLVLLSYFEVAMNKGYANLSMLGLGANKYAELSYNYRRYSETFGGSVTQMDKKEALAIKFDKKSLMFSKAADDMINKYTNGTYDLKLLETAGLIDDDLVVGLNQFASAQYFYIGMGIPMISKILPGDIFSFNSDFARTHVPRLYMFTNYLWATGNIYAGSLNTLSLATPLTKVVEYGRANKDNPRPAGSMTRIINSKIDNEKSVFSYENTKLLANAYKPFKDWLMENGWTAQDFK